MLNWKFCRPRRGRLHCDCGSERPASRGNVIPAWASIRERPYRTMGASPQRLSLRDPDQVAGRLPPTAFPSSPLPRLATMHPFASYVLRSYYRETGWNEDNLYANLTRSSNGTQLCFHPRRTSPRRLEQPCSTLVCLAGCISRYPSPPTRSSRRHIRLTRCPP